MTDQDLEQRAKRLFADSVDELDGQTLSRLNQGRHQALDAASRRPVLLRYAPIGGLVAAAAIAIVMFQSPSVTLPAPPESASDVDILLSDDSLDMFEELEFFAWMETNESGTNDTSG